MVHELTAGGYSANILSEVQTFTQMGLGLNAWRDVLTKTIRSDTNLSKIHPNATLRINRMHQHSRASILTDESDSGSGVVNEALKELLSKRISRRRALIAAAKLAAAAGVIAAVRACWICIDGVCGK